MIQDIFGRLSSADLLDLSNNGHRIQDALYFVQMRAITAITLHIHPETCSIAASSSRKDIFVRGHIEDKCVCPYFFQMPAGAVPGQHAHLHPRSVREGDGPHGPCRVATAAGNDGELAVFLLDGFITHARMPSLPCLPKTLGGHALWHL